MANQIYNNFKKLALSGAVNLFTAPIYMILTSGNYTFSQTHSLTGSVSGEIVSAGYVKGGVRIPNTTVLIDTVDNEAVLSGNNITFTGITATLNYGLLWLSGGTPSTAYLMAQLDFGAQTVTAADFSVNWNSEGILNLM